MKEWVIYALIAAVFISIRDIISYDLIKNVSYINYIIIYSIF